MDAPKMEDKTSLKEIAYIACTAYILFLFITGCAKEEVKPSAQNNDEVEQTIKKFSAEHIKNSERKWNLASDIAHILKSERIKTQKPKVTIFENGKGIMTIISDTGEIDQRTKDLRFYGNVIATADDKTQIETAELFWRERDEKILAPGEVKVSKGRSVLFGNQLEAEPNLDTVKLKNIKATVYTKRKT